MIAQSAPVQHDRGLLTGFAIPAPKNPHMALSSHLEAVLNGMFLVVLGLLSPHIDLPNAWRFTAVVLIAYSAYANWLAALLAAAWGAGRKLAPTMAADHEASPANKGLVSFLLAYLSLSIVVGLGIVIVGL